MLAGLLIRARDERGQAGGMEMLPFGVLIFVAGSLLIFNVWAVIDTKAAAEAAAREAARVFVEAPAPPGDPVADDVARWYSVESARRVLEARGLDPSPAYVVVDAPGLIRCAPVDVSVSYPVAYVSMPFLGSFGPDFTVTATHTERVDPYRSGLAAGPSQNGPCR